MKRWTDEEIDYLHENLNEKSFEELAAELNRKVKSVRNRVYYDGLKKEKKEKEYALYKGDKFLVMGTPKEIAEHQNVNVESVRYLKTPSHKKTIKKSKRKNIKMLINLEE